MGRAKVGKDCTSPRGGVITVLLSVRWCFEDRTLDFDLKFISTRARREGGVEVVLLGSRFSIEFDPVASLIIIPSPIHFIYRDTSKGASSLFLKEHPPWSTLFFLELYIGSPQPLHLSSSSPLRCRFYSGISTGHSSDGNVFSPIIPRSFYPELTSPTFWIIFGTKRKYSSRFVNFTGYSTPTNLHDFNANPWNKKESNLLFYYVKRTYDVIRFHGDIDSPR